MKPTAKRPFRLIDSMVLVAATAVAFAIFRHGLAPGLPFTTLIGINEQRIFYWMHQGVPFPAMWTFALFAIAGFDRRTPRRRKFRHAGMVACCAATAALGVTTLIASTFYAIHSLEDLEMIPKIFTHPTGQHAMPPFANAPMEEIVGPAVLGAWSVLAIGGRWKADRSWIDRTGCLLGIIWIGLFLTYLYGYTG